MRFFTALYNKVMTWSKHRHAPYYLFSLSFAESSFFPLPPDVMLAPIALARPERAWFYAFLTTFSSVLGGLFGYLLGYFFFRLIHPYIIEFGYGPAYQQIELWFKAWGFWIIFMAGFTPIPYKLFTIGAGAISLPLLPFTIASIIGRGGRFFLVCGLIKWKGEHMERMFIKYVDRLGWLLVIAAIIGYLVWRYTGAA